MSNDITPERLAWAVAVLNKHIIRGAEDWAVQKFAYGNITVVSPMGHIQRKRRLDNYFLPAEAVFIAEGLENAGLRARVETEIQKRLEDMACGEPGCITCVLRELLEASDARI